MRKKLDKPAKTDDNGSMPDNHEDAELLAFILANYQVVEAESGSRGGPRKRAKRSIALLARDWGTGRPGGQRHADRLLEELVHGGSLFRIQINRQTSRIVAPGAAEAMIRYAIHHLATCQDHKEIE